MIAQVKLPVALIAAFVWVGFVCAISFMEAWLKFRAPGITLPIGLGIGRLVFGVLNKVEWVLAIAIFINILLANQQVLSMENLFFALVVLILLLQSFYLLPQLDQRAEIIIQGQNPGSSNLHIIFIAAEVVKVTALTAFGIKLFK